MLHVLVRRLLHLASHSSPPSPPPPRPPPSLPRPLSLSLKKKSHFSLRSNSSVPLTIISEVVCPITCRFVFSRQIDLNRIKCPPPPPPPHTHTHTCMRQAAAPDTHTCMRQATRPPIPRYTPTHPHTHTHTCMRQATRPPTPRHTPPPPHTHTHTRLHEASYPPHTHTHTHTCIRQATPFLPHYPPSTHTPAWGNLGSRSDRELINRVMWFSSGFSTQGDQHICVRSVRLVVSLGRDGERGGGGGG